MAVTIISPEAFEAAVNAHLKACGTSAETLGVEIEHGPRKVVIHLARHRLATMRPMISNERRDEQALKDAKRYLSTCWSSHQWNEGVLAAGGFLFGSDDGVHRPYMVESALIRVLTMRGMDMERLRATLAPGRRGSGDQAMKDHVERVWSTFSPHDRPAQFQEWCWRTAQRNLTYAFDIGTDIQFRLTGRNGWGLMPYMEVAPGIMWVGGPCPQLWLRDMDFPLSIMNSAKGRPLTDVIGMDEFDVPGLKVLNMRHDGKRTVVMVSAPKEDATAIADGIREGRRPAKAA